MTETLIRCPRCKGLFYSLQNHFCAIPADWKPKEINEAGK
jgi:hypothetical protein